MITQKKQSHKNKIWAHLVPTLPTTTRTTTTTTTTTATTTTKTTKHLLGLGCPPVFSQVHPSPPKSTQASQVHPIPIQTTFQPISSPPCLHLSQAPERPTQSIRLWRTRFPVLSSFWLRCKQKKVKAATF